MLVFHVILIYNTSILTGDITAIAISKTMLLKTWYKTIRLHEEI